MTSDIKKKMKMRVSQVFECHWAVFNTGHSIQHFLFENPN